MINIKYDIKEKELNILKGLYSGYYLIRERGCENVLIMSICGDIIHFHENKYLCYANVKGYDDFDSRYEIIGKIKDFDISNIKLEGK